MPAGAAAGGPGAVPRRRSPAAEKEEPRRSIAPVSRSSPDSPRLVHARMQQPVPGHPDLRTAHIIEPWNARPCRLSRERAASRGPVPGGTNARRGTARCQPPPAGPASTPRALPEQDRLELRRAISPRWWQPEASRTPVASAPACPANTGRSHSCNTPRKQALRGGPTLAEIPT